MVKSVLQVENKKLTAQDFSKTLAQKLKNLDSLAAKDPQIVNKFKEAILSDFVISSLIDLWLEEHSIALNESEMAAEIASITSQYPSDAAFQESLAASGQSFSDWRNQLRERFKKKLVLKALSSSSLPPTESELQSFYSSNENQFVQNEAVRLSHIFVKDQSESDIIKKHIKAANFSELAKQYSYAYSADNKDLFGWLEPGVFPEADRLFKQSVGSVFGPIQLNDGIHYFKILEKRAKKKLTFEVVRDRVLASVLSLRENAQFKSWLDVQLKRYSIKKNQDVVNSISVETQ